MREKRKTKKVSKEREEIKIKNEKRKRTV